MELLNYPFDGATILQKKRAIKKELLAGGPFADKRIALMSGSTLGDIRPVLELFLLNGGIRPTFHEGDYGLFYENIMFDSGALAQFAPEVLYIHTSVRNIKQWPLPGDSPEEAEDKCEAEFARFRAVWQAAKGYGCPVIQNNFEEPAFRNFGNLDAWDLRGRVAFVRRLNEKMAAYARENPGFYIHDLAWLAAQTGLEGWCDDAIWYAYKYACAPAHIPTLCHSLAGLIKSLFGFTKKAVVSDLDNTLWGGIIGEVGPEGVELGSETPTGMAFAEFQNYLKLLAGRGILLAVASKNEEAAAESGFGRESSPLKREDFLAFKANWGPKSLSIEAIAQQLNIGADSLVFVDDNPAEREEVRSVWPQVAAPPIGPPEASIRLLDRGGYFEVSALSSDDVARGQMYRQNAARQQEAQSFASYDDYLRGLEMRAEIGPFRADQLERVTQLINKTNQFNLTTRRYSAAEVEARAQDQCYITLSGRLVDKFGDNGITTALIGKINGDQLDIELWVMSCRVFKRQLEHALFDALVAEAQKRGIRRINGLFLPTAKNLLVQDFYATIGFDQTGERDGQRSFSYQLPANYQAHNTAIEVE